ncbi:hypothetical protein DINM_000239 [Dirofilaria immitis]|nr:hypothetical protein [Dirofilaria immitis]
MLLVMIAYGDNVNDIKIDIKRDVSLSDIIQGALNFVRPIIRTSESMQSDLMASRKFQPEQIGGRDAEILGLPKHSTLDDMPICKSNLKICKFITCTARNFQNDESIVNLNLAAQILGDTKLRKMIASDPNDPYYDDSDAQPIPIQPGRYQNIGSQTWSVNRKNISNPELLPQKLQLNNKQNLSESPILPDSVKIAPMIFQPSPSAGSKLDALSPMNLMTKEMQLLMSHFNNNLLSSNIMSLPLSSPMLPEQSKPMNSVGSIRNKRSDDYYDNIDKENDEADGSTGSSIHHIINDSNQQLPKFQKQTINRKGNNNQSPLKLSSLVQNAADMLKLFEKIANPIRNAQYTEQIIQKRQLMRQLSAPIEFRSGRKALPVKPLIESSLDNTPTVVFKGNHQSKTIAEDTAWAELLFGPRGVLTAVFHILDNRRKITEKIRSRTPINNKNSNDNSQTTNTYHQSDLSLLPDFLVDEINKEAFFFITLNRHMQQLTDAKSLVTASGVRTHEDLPKPIDFAKIFEAFLTGSKGNFDERIFNLPEILGICNRLSCGDIYKAIDEFRKSEFFINFQTALQLIQDPKGWEILGDLIANPEFIAQFMNGSGVKGKGDGIGNLFGNIIGAEKLSKIIIKIENGIDIDGTETIIKPDVIMTPKTTTIASLKQIEILPMIPDLILPEISENIDQIEQTKIVIDATVPMPTKVLSRQTAVTLRRLRPYSTVTHHPDTAKTAFARKQTIISKNRITTTSYPQWTVTTIRRSTPTTTTTKNFREESDYYAMYYDNTAVKGLVEEDKFRSSPCTGYFPKFTDGILTGVGQSRNRSVHDDDTE